MTPPILRGAEVEQVAIAIFREHATEAWKGRWQDAPEMIHTLYRRLAGAAQAALAAPTPGEGAGDVEELKRIIVDTLSVVANEQRWRSALHALDALLARLAAVEQKLRTTERERDEWKNAIIDATVCNWTYQEKHENDPRAAVNALLAWESQVALDPAVSEEAAKLYAERDALKEGVIALEDRIDRLETELEAERAQRE